MLCRGPGADPCCELRRVLPRPPEKHVIATGPISPRRLRHHAFLPEQHHLVQELRRAQLRWIGLGYACQMLARALRILFLTGCRESAGPCKHFTTVLQAFVPL